MMSLQKPSRLKRDRAKWSMRQVKASERRKVARLELKLWQQTSRAVMVRDEGRCRVCCVETDYPPCDPALIGQAHHIAYRSAGGCDELWNLVWVCMGCSEREHLHTINITGTADNLRVETLQ